MELLSNIPHKTQKDYIERELSEFEVTPDLHDIFKEAIDAIQSKIQDAGDFTPETELAYKQLQEIRDLYELFQGQYMSRSLTRLGNSEIGDRFRSIITLIQKDDDLNGLHETISTMIDAELDRLADTFFANTFRDKVEKSIDFKARGLRGSYNETSAMTEFLDAFTLEYINFIENREGSKILGENIGDDLLLSDDELDRALINTMNRLFDGRPDNYTAFLQFNIGFTLSGSGEVERDLSEFGPVIDENNIESIQTYDGAEIIENERDSNIKTDSPDPTHSPVEMDDSIILPDSTIDLIETDNHNTLTEFIDENGIPDSSKEIISGLFEKYGAFAENMSEEDKGKIYDNLSVLIKFIVAVESYGGQNVKNTEGSSAKGPFQYIDGYIDGVPTTTVLKDDENNPRLDENGNEIREIKYNRETGDFSPFDTALRRNMEFYASQSPDYENDYYNYSKYSEYIPEWVIESYENQPELSPLDLSWEESINMWLVDSFCRSKTQEYLRGIVLHGDASDMKRFYDRIHHTAPDAGVNENVQQHFDTFAEQLNSISNLIFSPRPVRRP